MSARIPAKYLLFLGDVSERLDVKTAAGILQWRPELCVGQLRLTPDAFDLGLPDLAAAQAKQAGAETLVIGVAPFGGVVAPQWRPHLLDALSAGLDIASGLHVRLGEDPEFAAAARAAGRRIHDVRRAEGPFAVGSGRKRTGMRLLTVGTDCAVGKKYTALAIHRELAARGLPATFRATGQTGILIAGAGIAIDSTVADFVSGAAEALSPDNAADHWDVIEGQGTLFHPAYAPVTLGLVHGSQPDAIVLCHDPLRTHLDGYPAHAIASIERGIEEHLHAARLTNPDARAVGVSFDTSAMHADERARLLEDATTRTGLPAIDPIATGAGAIVDAISNDFPPPRR